MTQRVPAALTENEFVLLTGDQTVAGVKTFSSQPVLPQRMTLDTVRASTSGTAVDFTGIPAWATRVTVMMRGVSTNSTSALLLRLGTSGGFVATGYSGAWTNPGAATGGNNSVGHVLYDVMVAADTFQSVAYLTRMDATNNVWAIQSVTARSSAAGTVISVGTILLGASTPLTQLRITSATPDTFDAGLINILYE